jgi:hypothetical protein
VSKENFFHRAKFGVRVSAPSRRGVTLYAAPFAAKGLSMASRTVWADVYKYPDDEEKWLVFRDWYKTRIYNWAKWELKDEQAAKEVTVNVFTKLYETVIRRNAAQVIPQDGTCFGFVTTVIRSMCGEHGRGRGKSQALVERLVTKGPVRRLRELVGEDEPGDGPAVVETRTPIVELIEDEGDDVTARQLEFTEKVMVELGERFPGAIRKWWGEQTSHKEASGSWDVFVAAYSVEPYPGLGTALNARFGYAARGAALKTANRVADRLCDHLDLVPYDTDCEKAVRPVLRHLIRTLVTRNGFPPG